MDSMGVVNNKSFYGLNITFSEVEKYLKLTFPEIDQALEWESIEYFFYISFTIFKNHFQCLLKIKNGKVTHVQIEDAEEGVAVIYDGSKGEESRKRFDMLYRGLKKVVIEIEKLFLKEELNTWTNYNKILSFRETIRNCMGNLDDIFKLRVSFNDSKFRNCFVIFTLEEYDIIGNKIDSWHIEVIDEDSNSQYTIDETFSVVLVFDRVILTNHTTNSFEILYRTLE